MLNRQPGQMDGLKPAERGITVERREFVKEKQEVGGTGVRCSVFRNWPDGVSFLKPALPRPISKNRTPDPGYIHQPPTGFEFFSQILFFFGGPAVPLRLLSLRRVGLKRKFPPGLRSRAIFLFPSEVAKMSKWFQTLTQHLIPVTRRKTTPRFAFDLESLEARQLLTASPIAVSSVADITATKGKVSGEVATFTDATTGSTTRDFKATVSWGDGSTSKGKVVAGTDGGFEVTAKHHYKGTGPRQVTVTVSDKSANAASDGAYLQTNLVSDQPGVAAVTDPNLVNPWGLAASPTREIWINDNGTGLSTLYDPQGQIMSLVVTVPGPPGSTDPATPTGIVSNGTPDFGTTTGASHFIFATEDGTISAWSSGTLAELKVDNSASGAVYKGLALGASGGNNFLYATDFHNGKIDVFDKNYAAVQPAGNFQVPKLPAGYAPFGIENINGTLFVTYAKQDADKHDDVQGAGLGFVAEFSTDGQFIKTLVAKGPLNAPWGIQMAPPNFGQFSNDLLIANFGDGWINAFDPQTGKFLGSLTNDTGHQLSISGLWGLNFGNGAGSGASNALYFTAGPDDEAHGLYGNLVAVGQPTHVNPGT
jgi:uncharacterized protein (TIGR03118 family)